MDDRSIIRSVTDHFINQEQVQKEHTSAVEQTGPNFPPRPEAYMFGVMYKGLLFQLLDVILSCKYLDKHSIFALLGD